MAWPWMPSAGSTGPELLREVTLPVLCALCVQAGVTVTTSASGATVYRRDATDRAFNARGLGHPPPRMDPYLWYVYDPYIVRFSQAAGVDPVLAKAVIYVESRFQWKATSKAKARGLMQMIKPTGERYGLRDNPYDPIANIQAGVAFLAALQTRYRGNLIKISAAYNAGEGAVDKHQGVPPYKETQAYVPAVLSMYLRIHSGA